MSKQRSADKAVERPIMVGPLRLDPASGELWHGLDPVALAPLPTSALRLLAASPNRLVPRETLRDELWAEPPLEWEKSLYFCILQIRKALSESAGATNLLETIPRRGYRLRASVADAVTPASTVWRRRSLVAASALATLLVAGWVIAATMLGRAVIDAPVSTSILPDVKRLLDEGDYLLARFHPDAASQAVARFEQALESRPRSERAWSGLAAARFRHWWVGQGDVEAAREAAGKAVELSAESARGHQVLGDIATLVDWDFDAAAAHYVQAIAVDPADPMLRIHYASLLQIVGDLAGSVEQIDAAVQIDSPSALVLGDAAWAYLHAGRAQQALEAGRRALELAPEPLVHHELIMLAARSLGDFEHANRVARQFVADRGSDLLRERIAQAAGDDVDRLFAALAGVPHRGPSAMVSRAIYQAAAGDDSASMDGLEQGLATGAPFLLLRLRDPRLSTLCSEPRFADLHATLGIPLPATCTLHHSLLTRS